MLTPQVIKRSATDTASRPASRFGLLAANPNKLCSGVSPLCVANADATSGSNDSHDATRMVTSAHSDRPPAANVEGVGNNNDRRSDSLESRSGGSQCSAESTRQRPTQLANQRKRAASPGATSPGPNSRPRSGAKAPCLSGERAPDAWAQQSGRGKTSPNKKARMTWDADLHRQFLKALSKFGLRHAVPKTIMQACPCDRDLLA